MPDEAERRKQPSSIMTGGEPGLTAFVTWTHGTRRRRPNLLIADKEENIGPCASPRLCPLSDGVLAGDREAGQCWSVWKSKKH
jgi:hypothetical protein